MTIAMKISFTNANTSWFHKKFAILKKLILITEFHQSNCLYCCFDRMSVSQKKFRCWCSRYFSSVGCFNEKSCRKILHRFFWIGKLTMWLPSLTWKKNIYLHGLLHYQYFLFIMILSLVFIKCTLYLWINKRLYLIMNTGWSSPWFQDYRT